jgi:AAA domain
MKDWNDAYKAGVDIRAMADKVNAYKGDNVVPLHASPYTLICLADVDVESVEWLWDNRLAKGKITILGGDPDIGKSQISIDVAARLSRALHWPHGTRAPRGSTICLCSEDGVSDTVRPRAEAAGADLSQVHVLESRLVKNNKVTRFNLQDDLDILAAAIDRVGNARLVNIDALTSYVGKVDNNSQSDIRPSARPSVAICGGKRRRNSRHHAPAKGRSNKRYTLLRRELRLRSVCASRLLRSEGAGHRSEPVSKREEQSWPKGHKQGLPHRHQGDQLRHHRSVRAVGRCAG